MAPEKPYYDNLVTAAPLERILWLASFGWAVYKADDLIFSRGVLSCWIGLLLLGAAAPYAIHGLYNPSTTDPKLKLDRVSSGTSSEDFIPGSDLPASPSLKQASRKQRHQHPLNRMVGVGLFGASRNSLRGDADDGILCGTLLLPMVGIAKITDIAKTEMDQAHFARVHAVLELTFLTAFLFLVLIAANALLQPLRRSLRKRSFFFLSLMVSALFTFVMTQILPLTPFLREVPNIVTMGAVLAFQWSLYICVVALKRSFTLGEMCVLSQAIAVLVFGSLCMVKQRIVFLFGKRVKLKRFCRYCVERCRNTLICQPWTQLLCYYMA
ncbi:hypothetical protein BX666DRAFT_1001679 [Dichotomocladium elegans]|nr:hypothetical protein BX666DRAFT_1001679 [Dichotomocladium elegans]